MNHYDEELANNEQVIDERCFDCPIFEYGCTVCRDLF